jgi:hypothetical protein
VTRVDSQKRAVVVLTPSESKRLIGRAVASLPEVKRALARGRLIVGNGTTNAFVVEEITGESVSKWRYAAGVIAGGRLDVTSGKTRLSPVALDRGRPCKGGWIELLQEFGRGDVFIKGANAIDPEGNVGILLASDLGGTVGQAYGIVAARGGRLIVPVGLEKMVPDVVEASRHCGIAATDLTDGTPVGMAVIPNARVVTELEAFETLFGVAAWHLASGGVAGSEGAVTIALEGSAASIARALKYTDSIGGEAQVTRRSPGNSRSSHQG